MFSQHLLIALLKFSTFSNWKQVLFFLLLKNIRIINFYDFYRLAVALKV